MKNVWILVGLVFAVVVLLFLAFLIESLIYCKIEEIKERKIKKKLLEETIENINKNIEEYNNIVNEAINECNNECNKLKDLLCEIEDIEEE